MTAEVLRREVVTHPADFRLYNRPFVILGEQANPAFPDQYIALGISTVDAPGAIRITDSDWEVGGLSRESFVDPWPRTGTPGVPTRERPYRYRSDTTLIPA